MMYGGDIVRVSAIYEYTSNNHDESPEQAKNNAIQKAREKALEEKFELDVSNVSSTYVHSRIDEEETSSVADVFALGGTALRGEWIETIEEKVLEESYMKGFWVIKVYVSGKARNNTKEKTEIKYALINNTHDKYGRDQYHDGDDIFLRFSSLVNGSLCVYLIDESQNAYCLKHILVKFIFLAIFNLLYKVFAFHCKNFIFSRSFCNGMQKILYLCSLNSKMELWNISIVKIISTSWKCDVTNGW